jgi:hypothetical protein
VSVTRRAFLATSAAAAGTWLGGAPAIRRRHTANVLLVLTDH